MKIRSPLLLTLALFCACSSDSSQLAAPGPDTSSADLGSEMSDAREFDSHTPGQDSCEDYTTRIECIEGECSDIACRGDEVCEIGQCVPWQESELSVDFDLRVDPDIPNRIHVEVLPGGFPRSHVDALRFDFGDQTSGWGETLSHTYPESGIFAVELEVRLSGHRILTQKKRAVVGNAPEHSPLILTINDIPSFMNGSQAIPLTDSEPYSFNHLVPHDHFDINLQLLEDPENPIEHDTVRLTAIHPDDTFDLTDELRFDGSEVAEATLEIRDSNAMPPGIIELEVFAQTQDGQPHRRSLTIETILLPPDQDPRARPTIWLFRDDLDFFTTQRVPLNGSQFSLNSTSGPNGSPDFHEELALMGLLGSNDALNSLYLAWIRDSIRTETYRYFGIGPDGSPHDGIEITIVWNGEEDAPDPEDFDPAGTFSMMRFGGVFDGFVGFSGYSAHNQDRIDNSTVSRGVASAAVISGLSSTPGISDAFAQTHPELGTPLGSHEFDSLVLAPNFDPYDAQPEVKRRYDALKALARSLALALAPVTAHEMGHAMGLMPDGLPPQGFFGNVQNTELTASRTNSRHADLPGLNLMQAGGDPLELLGRLGELIEREQGIDLIEIATILSLETRMSSLSRAYLQGRLTYLNKD